MGTRPLSCSRERGAISIREMIGHVARSVAGPGMGGAVRACENRETTRGESMTKEDKSRTPIMDEKHARGQFSCFFLAIHVTACSAASGVPRIVDESRCPDSQ